LVAAGGVVLGLVVALAVDAVTRAFTRFDLSDSLIENLLLIITPYLAYLSGQALHVSGVLAVVVAGISLSRRSTDLFSPQTRLVADNVWTMWLYILNAYIFLAIGLQLRTFVAGGSRLFDALPAAIAVSITAIVVRLLWAYPTYRIAGYVRELRGIAVRIPFNWAIVVGWSGMRGIVSLAAALALPTSFAHRDTIVFITFVVIFITLVGQGLTMNSVLRWLRVEKEADDDVREVQIRTRALEAGLARIGELEAQTHESHAREDLEQLRHEYETRIAHLQAGIDGPAGYTLADVTHDYAEKEALRAERTAIMRLRDNGDIPDEIFRKIQYDLDLAESRLA
jgi:CPA1 family monovalent cation:H+ antiporter